MAAAYSTIESNYLEEADQDLAEDLMKRLGIPMAESTSRSVEELSAIIIQNINKI